jgi:Family of unknown function (DUF5309)
MPTGIFNTAPGFTAQDLVKKSFASAITRLMPNGDAPLFGMTSMLPEETAVQVEHGFFTKTMLFPNMVNGASSAASTDTTLTVVSTANIIPGMLLRNEATSEVILVNAIVSPTQVSVQRGVGTVAAATIGAGANLFQTGTAYEESSLRPQALSIQPVRITNFTQIFRNTWAVSESMRATLMIAGDTNVAENKQDCMAFHAADIEKALFFGQKSQGTRNGQPFRTMDGLQNIISQLANYPSIYSAVNVFTAGGTTNYAQLEGFLDPCFNQNTDPKNGPNRVLFVGGQARRVISGIGRLSTNASYNIEHGQTEYGLQFDKFKISRGNFKMIEHPLFNSNSVWTRYAFAVDLASFRVAYLAGRKTKHKPFNMSEDATDQGIDAVGGTLTTELTCVVKNPPANALIRDLQAPGPG